MVRLTRRTRRSGPLGGRAKVEIFDVFGNDVRGGGDDTPGDRVGGGVGPLGWGLKVEIFDVLWMDGIRAAGVSGKSGELVQRLPGSTSIKLKYLMFMGCPQTFSGRLEECTCPQTTNELLIV